MDALLKISKQIIIAGSLAVASSAGMAIVKKGFTDGVEGIKQLELEDLLK